MAQSESQNSSYRLRHSEGTERAFNQSSHQEREAELQPGVKGALQKFKIKIQRQGAQTTLDNADKELNKKRKEGRFKKAAKKRMGNLARRAAGLPKEPGEAGSGSAGEKPQGETAANQPIEPGSGRGPAPQHSTVPDGDDQAPQTAEPGNGATPGEEGKENGKNGEGGSEKGKEGEEQKKPSGSGRESVNNPDGTSGIRDKDTSKKAMTPEEEERHKKNMDDFEKDPAAYANKQFDDATKEREDKKKSEGESKSESGGEGEGRDKDRKTKKDLDSKKKGDKEKKKGLKEKVKAKVDEAAQKAQIATGQALQLSWLNLIDSIGLTMFYIDFHIIMYYLGGPFSPLFCQPGMEWLVGNGGGGAAGGGTVMEKIKHGIAAKALEIAEIIAALSITLLMIAVLILIIILISAPFFCASRAMLGEMIGGAMGSVINLSSYFPFACIN